MGIRERGALFSLLKLGQSVNLFIIKVFEVLIRDLAKLFMSLKQQVVWSCHMIMFVGVDTFYSVIFLEVILDQEIQDLDIDGNLRKTDKNSTSDFLMRDLVEPRVLPNVRDLKALFWVSIKNICNEISWILWHKLRNSIISIEDFLVEICCVGVFEGKVTANHRKKDYTTAPNVHVGTQISLSSYHLRGCIARRATSGFQCLSCFVGIWKSEIDYLNILSMIKKQIFRFQIST